MNDQIKDELHQLMLLDQYNDVGDQLNIISKVNKLLGDGIFMSHVGKALGGFLNHPEIGLKDMGAILLSMTNLIPLFEDVLRLYRSLDITKMRYILYGILYAYVVTNKPDFLKKVGLSDFRVEYNNIFNLLKVPVEAVEIESKLVQRIKEWFIDTFTCGKCTSERKKFIVKSNPF